MSERRGQDEDAIKRGLLSGADGQQMARHHSGDSELAEIRKRLADWPYQGWAVTDCHTLLRMVDELRDRPEFDATDAAHPAWWRGHDHTAKKFEGLVSELRAKLAESEQHAYRANLSNTLSFDRAKELEAKLAKAEELHDIAYRMAVADNQRAEAAESRLRILEAENATLRRELEAKLAERKREHEGCLDDLESVARRAEAAESRVKELESHRCPQPHDIVEGIRRDRLGRE